VTTLTIIGLDIAKSSFQIHGVAACGLWQFVPEQAPGKCVPRLPQVFSRIAPAGGQNFMEQSAATPRLTLREVARATTVREFGLSAMWWG
jgi:hypothetical protein